MEEKGGGNGGRRRRSRATSSSGSTAAAAAAERKEMERRRRQEMKGLCVKLASLIPKEHYSKGATMTQLSSLDEAAEYIKKLKEKVDELHHRRTMASTITSGRPGGHGHHGGVVMIPPSTSSGVRSSSEDSGVGSSSEDMTCGEEEITTPVVEVRHHVQDGSSSLDVVLICSAERPVKFHEVITVLEEEGAEIINANFSVAGNKIYYTIYSRAFSSRIGIEASRISERLRALLV
ncbi:hypothetical protein E2562_012651 [Oryza meyeriana var. granulata]|uniref:BHLH domain-containing protein n=1 Tax=Oryza meyeriana var. granulata TaxID=110450 RepID=A0A6G1CH77_9ORYZ|nr:hypothetical protein E2562_012651 [Oryza meyeriana var. granulata]